VQSRRLGNNTLHLVRLAGETSLKGFERTDVFVALFYATPKDHYLPLGR
jgi:hypothetical protein